MNIIFPESFFVFIYLLLISVAINSYLVFPFIMILVGKIKKSKDLGIYEPSISIIISAHNEEKVIENRIKNISLQNYNFAKIEVLIGSDASTDSTNQLLSGLEQNYPWLRIFLFSKRAGKAEVLNKLISFSSNDIIVFTDANTIYRENALKSLIKGFSDKRIGGICGKLELLKMSDEFFAGVEEKVYWDFENLIKIGEGSLGILIGANGANYSIRSSLVDSIPIEKPVTDDLFLTLSIINKGYKFIYESKSVAMEFVSGKLKEELYRKVRISSTNFQTMSYFKNLFFYPLISYVYISHKVVRWIFPIIMLMLLILNVFIYKIHYLFTYSLILQLLFYSFSFLGGILSLMRVRIKIFSFPFYFFMSNLALLFGLVKYLRRRHSSIW